MPGLAAPDLSFFFSSAPSALTGLCRVPFFSSSTGLAAFSTLAGAFIMSRIAKASASAFARRTRMFSSSSSRTFAAAASATFCFSSTSALAFTSSAVVSVLTVSFSTFAFASAFSDSSRALRSISAFMSAS